MRPRIRRNSHVQACEKQMEQDIKICLNLSDYSHQTMRVIRVEICDGLFLFLESHKNCHSRRRFKSQNTTRDGKHTRKSINISNLP
jgi:hypothetical protein